MTNESELFPLLAEAMYYCSLGTECSGSKVGVDRIDTYKQQTSSATPTHHIFSSKISGLKKNINR